MPRVNGNARQRAGVLIALEQGVAQRDLEHTPGVASPMADDMDSAAGGINHRLHPGGATIPLAFEETQRWP